MVLSLFRSIQPVSLFILPVVAALLWIPAYIDPSAIDATHSMPLFTLVSSWLPGASLLSAIAGVIVVTSSAILLNYIVNEHEMLPRHTNLCGLFYVILMSCTPQLLTVHPVLFANIFLMLTLNKIMAAYRKDTAFGQVFDAGSLIGIATLFYLPSILLFPIIWVALVVLRPFIWREWVISLIGLVVPLMFAAVYYFWYDGLTEVWTQRIIWPLANRFFQFNASASFITLISVIGLLFVLSTGTLITGIRISKLKAKSSLLVIVWFSFFCAVSMLMAPSVSVMYYSSLAIPVSVFFANYFFGVKRLWWGELMFWLLISAIVYNHIASTRA